MVHRRLPQKRLVKVLRKFVGRYPERIERIMGRMEIADHRGERNRMEYPEKVRVPGGRVRFLDVSHRFPALGRVVVKCVHGMTAKEAIADAIGTVRRHNEKYSPKEYELREPAAYSLGGEYIVMAETKAPDVHEILYEKTKRGTEFFGKLKRKYGITEEHLRKAAKKVRMRTGGWTGIEPHNLLLLGVKKGKLIFMPLMDWH